MCRYCEHERKIEDREAPWITDEEEKYLRENAKFDEVLDKYMRTSHALEKACAENEKLKNDLYTFTNCLLPRATIQAGEEIKKGNYSLVTIVTNGERCEQKELLDKIEKLNDRYQSDCITINQLQTTIDVLVDKLARLREVHGL